MEILSKDRVVDTLKTTGVEYVAWDGDIAGFGVRVRPSGAKSYIVQYRAGAGRKAPSRKLTLGPVGKLTPDEARTLAKRAVGSIAHGHDPAGKRAEDRKGLTVAELGRAEIAAMVNDPATDSIVLEALFEGPGLLTGLDPATRDQLLKIAVERTAGPALAALAEQEEALSLLNAALRMSGETLRVAVDVATGAFDKWLADAAPVDPKDTAAELAKATRDTLLANAAALPLAERMSLVDTLIATNVAAIKAV
jgi:hypothetical protein